VTVSGRPAQQPNGVVRLVDLSIDNITDSNARAFVQQVVLPRIPQALEIDVATAVRSMLKQPNIPYTSDLERLDISAVTAENDRLGVTFDFKLLAK
jgi:bifunctional pyridoxal-dependent enzyme with beta-cystathionase and maltose regulon repressor activities